VQKIVDTMDVLDEEEIETLGRLCRKLGVGNAD
jgi:hypothetical protein